MIYPCHILPTGRSYLVTFPDIPEAITQGDSIEESLEMALDALETALDFYFFEGKPIPLPSPIIVGYYPIQLNSNLVNKVLEHNKGATL